MTYQQDTARKHKLLADHMMRTQLLRVQTSRRRARRISHWVQLVTLVVIGCAVVIIPMWLP